MTIQEIYTEAKAVMAERSHSTTVYCGWGTTIDSMVSDFCDQGGSWDLIRKVLNHAYYA